MSEITPAMLRFAVGDLCEIVCVPGSEPHLARREGMLIAEIECHNAKDMEAMYAEHEKNG